MNLKKGECKVLHLECQNSMQEYRLWANWLKGSQVEKGPEGVVDKLSTSEHYNFAAKTNSLQTCMRKSISCRLRGDSSLYSAPVRYWERLVQIWAVQYRGETQITDIWTRTLSTGCRAQDRGGETETAGFLQLREGKTQKDLTAVCKSLKEQCRAARAGLFSEMHSGSTRGSIHK